MPSNVTVFGVVDKVLGDRGIGWVRRDRGGRYFFVGQGVARGDRVQFRITKNERRPGEMMAVGVRRYQPIAFDE